MRRAPHPWATLAGLVAIVLLSAPVATQNRRPDARRTERVHGHDAIAGEVLVKWKPGTPPQDLAALRALADADAMDAVGRTGVRRLHSRSLDAAALVALLSSRDDVAYVEPNYVVHAFAEPNDPLFPQLWGLKNTGQPVNSGIGGVAGADIHATQAWDVSVGSTANVVAVIDTGIDYTHPDLASNVWSAPAAFTVTIGGVPITCPAGSHGFNAIAMTCDPMDDHNHGTHVSGTIGATGQNGVGVVGVNWVAQVMGIKFLDSSGSGSLADAISAIEFAIGVKQAFASSGGANIRVLSNSWGGGDFSQALLDEIRAAASEDMLFVAAAGNNGFSNDLLPTYPASYDSPNVIAVAATTNTDARAFFSNYGAASVHLGAPGFDVLSTTIGGTYSFFSGTSMATPHVSGAAALVLSRCQLDTAALKDVILSTVEPVAALKTITTSGGRLDVNSAIRSCVAAPAAPSNLTASAGDGQVTLSWGPATGATGYDVGRSVAPGGPYQSVATHVRGGTYVDTTVVNGTTYYYVVSAVNLVGGSGPSNEASATPNLPSDLVISALTVPTTSGAGARLTITETTQNRAAAGAVASTTRFYLSTNAVLDPLDRSLTAIHAVPALPAGGTSSATVDVDMPPDLPSGLYYFIARADADGVVNETSETNNIAWRALTVGPDLAVSSLQAPSTAAAGSTITVGDTVRNQGGGSAGSSVTKFYLSTNSTLDAADLPLNAARTVAGLAAGATDAGSTQVPIPATAATGSYYLIAKADADQTVVETQEGNNTAVRTLQIGGDLVVTLLGAPAKAAAGAPILVSETTSNQGAGPIGASVTRFYLSGNATLDANDTPLPGGRAVPDLAPGAASSGSTTLTIPAATAAGTYYVIAKADGDNLVSETQESNNAAARAIQIGGDLIVSALTVPPTAAAGSTIVVADTITNQGAGAVGASATRFFLSTDAVLDAGDPALGPGRAVPGLAAGGASAGATTLTVPPGTAPGSYYLVAKADGDGVVEETLETNNALARPLAIGPDLTISAMTVVSTAAAGSTVTVSETVANQGAASAGVSTTRFYLSVNVLFDAGDRLLDGSRAVAALPAGSTSAGTTSIVIPADTVPGTYYLFAVADADGGVSEGIESNNVRWRAIQVLPHQP
jgi:subtilisin family serine protease/uncharacterized membrane protein